MQTQKQESFFFFFFCKNPIENVIGHRCSHALTHISTAGMGLHLPLLRRLIPVSFLLLSLNADLRTCPNQELFVIQLVTS